uniref:Type I interferon 10 n=1 Tax=Xenopus laevis TaxID=8355 RepID=A0A1B1FFU3_XENLA|nr:type I interferon 10 [Xenopus laevis]
MAPAKFQLTKLFVVLAMTILQQVRPSSASSPECQWLDKKGEHIENEILIVLDQLQPKEEIQDDCFDEVPHYGFPNNIVLSSLQKDYEKLLSLLRYVMNNLTPCVTNAEQYKNVTERTSNQYTEFENYVQKWGNTACAQIIFWLISKNVQEAVHLSSQMRKINLMNKTS